MNSNKKIVCVIPVRLASTRFPRKALAQLCGKPLLAWIWEAAKAVTFFDSVVFAIDAPETAAVINSFGGRFVMTSVDCQSGTDRLVELATSGQLQADVWVNWQGDEPFIDQTMIAELLQTIDDKQGEMWTLKKLITDAQDIASPKVAKVVCDKQGRALYFSRSPIPFFREESDAETLIKKQVYYKHVGLYAFTTAALKKIAAMGQSVHEDAEKLEQLRFLDYGLRIHVHETQTDVFGIDFPQDLVKAELRIKQRQNN